MYLKMEDSAFTELYAVNIEDTLSGKRLFMLKKRTVVSYCTLPHTVVRNRSSKQVICKEKEVTLQDSYNCDAQKI